MSRAVSWNVPGRNTGPTRATSLVMVEGGRCPLAAYSAMVLQFQTMAVRIGLSLSVALTLLITGCHTSREATSSNEARPEVSEVSPEAGYVYDSIGGQQITVVNPSENAIRLLDWAFSRFLEADLEEPPIDRIYFGDLTADCTSKSGWTRKVGGSVEVAVCQADERLCRNDDDSTLANPAKFCALHELAHGWLIEYASAETKTHFLNHTNLSAWMPTEETPWHERGAEYAAEVMAWGLMDTQLDLVRIESPDCDDLEVGFTILTGTMSLVRCDDTAAV